MRPADDARDLRLHLELLARLDLADGDRLLDDRALRDLDFLEPAVFLLPVADDGVDADRAERRGRSERGGFFRVWTCVALLTKACYAEDYEKLRRRLDGARRAALSACAPQASPTRRTAARRGRHDACASDRRAGRDGGDHRRLPGSPAGRGSARCRRGSRGGARSRRRRATGAQRARTVGAARRPLRRAPADRLRGCAASCGEAGHDQRARRARDRALLRDATSISAFEHLAQREVLVLLRESRGARGIEQRGDA